MLKRMRFLMVLITGALPISCALYQDPVGPPTLELHNDWQANSAQFQPAVTATAHWWQGFSDPVLNDLVESALQNNLDVREALSRIQQARSYYDLARWDYLPTGSAGLRRERGNFTGIGGEGQETTKQYITGLGMSWELDLFGRIRNGNRIALAELNSAFVYTDSVRLLVASEISNTYFLVRAAQDRRRIRIQALTDQRQIAELTRVLVEEERTAQDVLDQILAELAREEVELLWEEENISRLEHRISVLLGDQAAHWRLADSSNEQPPLIFESIPVADVSALLQSRPDIQLAQQYLISTQAAVGISKAEYFPSLNLLGYFGFLAGNVADLGKSESDNWFIGPSLTWNVLDIGRTRNEIGIANARVDGALLAYEKTVLQAIEETENALLRFTMAQAEIDLRQAQRSHARSAAGAAQARYEEGLESYLPVLVASRDALSAELGLATSVSGHRIATVDVFRALGAAP